MTEAERLKAKTGNEESALDVQATAKQLGMDVRNLDEVLEHWKVPGKHPAGTYARKVAVGGRIWLNSWGQCGGRRERAESQSSRGRNRCVVREVSVDQSIFNPVPGQDFLNVIIERGKRTAVKLHLQDVVFAGICAAFDDI